jgi:enterochelin esterase family protein
MACLARVFAGLCAAVVSLSAQQAHVNLDWAPHKNTQGLKPYGASLISPEVRDDGTVTFRVKAPDAQRVELTGGPILLALKRAGKPVPLTKDQDGVWSVTVGPVKPNMYVYRFVIDGAMVPDPNNTLTGFADQPPYSTVVIHGSEPAYYDARNVPHGAVTRHVYRSEVTGGEREMYVYTPPGYDRRKKYPVLYLLGGSGELASTWNIDGRAGFILDNLLAENKAVPMLIAMPNNQVLHRSDPQHTKKTFDLFEAELKKHIVPLVEKNYSVRADRRGRALAGLSMGGRHAQLVGFRNPDSFGSLGILSAGMAEGLKDPKVDYMFVGLGTFENTPENRSVLFHQALEKAGIKHDYYIGGDGGHDWGTWRDHLRYMLPKLFRN